MMGRPMLRYKVQRSTPEQWIGRPLRDIPEGDLWRWRACELAARLDYPEERG